MLKISGETTFAVIAEELYNALKPLAEYHRYRFTHCDEPPHQITRDEVNAALSALAFYEVETWEETDLSRMERNR